MGQISTFPASSSGGGAPTGSAGGVLSGTYPNPSFPNPTVFTKQTFGSTAISDKVIFYDNGGDNYGFGIDGTDTVVFAAASQGVTFKSGSWNGTTWVRITSAGIKIPTLASATGNRYICINSSGQLVSQAAACSGT